MNLTTLACELDWSPTTTAGAGSTLDRVLALAGRDTARLVCAPAGLDGPVRGITAWDPSMPAAEVIERHDLVLVTVSPRPDQVREIAERAAAAGASGLVLRPGDLPTDRPGQLADPGIAVFAAPAELPWPSVRRELLAALAMGPDDPPGARERAGDLHGLAEVTAAALGVPVLVTDGRLRMLAHHRGPAELDGATRDWIVDRTPPRPVRQRLPRAGELMHQWGASDIVRIAHPGGGYWTVAIVRAGGDVLGALWAGCPAAPAGHQPAAHQPADADARDAEERDTDRSATLRRAARRAAMLLARPGSVEPERRMRSDLLHAGLTGSGTANDLATAIGCADCAGVRVLAFQTPGGQPAELLEDLVALRVDAAASHAATTRIGDRVYAVLSDPVDLVALAGIVERAERAGWAGLRCTVSDPLEDPAELPRARREVDRLLELVGAGPSVATVAEFRAETVLAELGELARQRPTLRRGPVQRLVEIDRAEERDYYLPTLRAYFDTGQDLQRAADRLYVHRNTLRYRLGRVSELTGLDLADPVERLVAELQLRLHDLHDAASCDTPKAGPESGRNIRNDEQPNDRRKTR